MLEITNKLTSKGSDLSMSTWLTSSFFLPFKTSFEIDSFSDEVRERIKQQPINPFSKYLLYLKFSTETTYVIRVVAIYRCLRYIQFNSERNVFKSHELEQ